jgi:hypothetical protein
MALIQLAEETIRRYANRKTLIMGDVNSGKTHLTIDIIQAFGSTGHDHRMAILDLAPDETRGIGGKLALPPSHERVSLTCAIIPPRLTASNEAQVPELASQNAAAIEPLFDRILEARRSILFINDASLYLQAGTLERMLTLIDAHPTVVVNAYYGHTFAPTPFSHHERRQVEALSQHCDEIVRLERTVRP